MFRLLVMVGLLAAIGVATLTAQAQSPGAAGADQPGSTGDAASDTDSGVDLGTAPGTDAGQDASDPQPGLAKEPLGRVGQLFMYSPIVNGIILGLSGLALALFLFFMLSINNQTMAPPKFVDELVKLAIRGDYERAADVCRRSRGVFAAGIVQRIVENPGHTHSVMLDMIDTEGRRQADVIWNRVSYLADISNVAPMLGLLGTVLGMIKVFTELEYTTGSVTSQLLANGVGQAMSTTMFGLTVGIFTLVLYSIVKSRATRSLADAEQAVHMIADHLKRADTPVQAGQA